MSTSHHAKATARRETAEGPSATLPISARELVDDISGLVSPPAVHLRLLELIRSPNADIRQMGPLIAQDPSLTARLLHIVNSPFYGLRTKVDTISRAVTVVGLRELNGLVAAASVVSSFSRISISLVNLDTFWRHSLYTALIARSLARRCHVLHPERLFVPGLLHDLGSLVLYHKLPALMQDLLMVARGNEQALHQAELEELGFSHAELGSLLLEIWGLPDHLRECVAFHHNPAEAGDARLDAALVNMAEVLANRSELGAFCERPDPDAEIRSTTWDITSLSRESIDEEALVGEAGLEFTEMAGILSGRQPAPPGSGKNAGKPTPKERRSEPRQAREERLIIRVLSGTTDADLVGETLSSTTRDASLNGLKIRTERALGDGAVLYMWVKVADRPGTFLLTGRVQWSRREATSDDYVNGIRIEGGEEPDLAAWRTLLAPDLCHSSRA